MTKWRLHFRLDDSLQPTGVLSKTVFITPTPWPYGRPSMGWKNTGNHTKWEQHGTIPCQMNAVKVDSFSYEQCPTARAFYGRHTNIKQPNHHIKTANMKNHLTFFDIQSEWILFIQNIYINNNHTFVFFLSYQTFCDRNK